MKSIRILSRYLMAAITVIMSILISFPIQAQTINQKQAMPAYLQKLRHPPVEIYLLQ